MKKAWEMATELFLWAVPVIRSAEEQTWEDNLDVSVFYDQILVQAVIRAMKSPDL